MPQLLQIARFLRMLYGMPDSSTPLPVTLGRPATRAFEEAGYLVLSDVDGASESALLALHGVGPRAIEILRAHGVTLVP